MIKVLLYLWQLPQNLLGLIVVWLSKARYDYYYNVYFTNYMFGVSLGNYIIVNWNVSKNDALHEKGHQKQSKYLGWLYLIAIGLPSACGNLWDRMFHNKWSYTKRIKWYYSLPWEAWADKLGGVTRW